MPKTYAELQRELDNLRRLVSTLPVIEQAKGVLMQRYGLDADRAFDLLTRASQALGQRVSVLAEVVLEIAGVTESRHADPELVTALKGQMSGGWPHMASGAR